MKELVRDMEGSMRVYVYNQNPRREGEKEWSSESFKND